MDAGAAKSQQLVDGIGDRLGRNCPIGHRCKFESDIVDKTFRAIETSIGGSRSASSRNVKFSDEHCIPKGFISQNRMGSGIFNVVGPYSTMDDVYIEGARQFTGDQNPVKYDLRFTSIFSRQAEAV
jgi:hypothetical protein